MKNKILELRKETGFTQGALTRKYIYQDKQLIRLKMIEMTLTLKLAFKITNVLHTIVDNVF